MRYIPSLTRGLASLQGPSCVLRLEAAVLAVLYSGHRLHDSEEEAAADKKALELLTSSPYVDKLYTPGLFLRELAVRGPGAFCAADSSLGHRLHRP